VNYRIAASCICFRRAYVVDLQDLILFVDCWSLKMEAVCFFETLLTIKQST
jgi:hypothetical protein